MINKKGQTENKAENKEASPRQHSKNSTKSSVQKTTKAASQTLHPAPQTPRPALPKVTFQDFPIEVHVHKTALPQEIWFVPSQKHFFTLHVTFKGCGKRSINLTHPAINLLIDIYSKGCGKYKHQEIFKKLYDAYASINFVMNVDDAALCAWGPVESYESILDIATLCLTQPHLPSDELKQIKEIKEAEILESLKYPGTILNEACNAAFFSDQHPYRVSLVRLQEDLKRLKKKDLRNYLTFLGQDNAVIVISGPAEKGAEMIQNVEKFFKRLPLKGKCPVMPSIDRNKNVQSRHIDFDAPQSIAKYYMNTFSSFDPSHIVDDPLYFAKKIAFYAVASGGLNSLVFRKIRTELGLAYSCGGYINHLDLVQELCFYLGTQPQTLEKATQELQKLFATVGTKGISRQDFEWAKQEMLGSFVVSLDSSFQFVEYIASLRKRGCTAEATKTYMNQYNKVTYEQVLQAARILFNQDMTCFSVGKRNI